MTTWNKQLGAVSLSSQWTIGANLPTTFPMFDQFCRTARSNQWDTIKLETELMIKATGEALRAQAQDASPADPMQIEVEAGQEYKKLVEDFLVHPIPAPPAATPSPKP